MGTQGFEPQPTPDNKFGIRKILQIMPAQISADKFKKFYH